MRAENEQEQVAFIENILRVPYDIHVGKSLEFNGKVRASSHLIEGTLDGFLQGIHQQHFPEIFINLGDLIRSESKKLDLQAYRRLVGKFE